MSSSTTKVESYTFFFGMASPFSQHHTSQFTSDGIIFTSAEQYMMYQKAVLFGDDKMATAILATTNPRTQKKLGRQVKNFDQVIWSEKSQDIVCTANRAKFTQNLHLKTALLSTMGTVLVEASPFDRIWGIGMGKSNPLAKEKTNWKGRNLLGYILTQVRDEIHKEQDTDGKGSAEPDMKLKDNSEDVMDKDKVEESEDVVHKKKIEEAKVMASLHKEEDVEPKHKHKET